MLFTEKTLVFRSKANTKSKNKSHCLCYYYSLLLLYILYVMYLL